MPVKTAEISNSGIHLSEAIFVSFDRLEILKSVGRQTCEADTLNILDIALQL